ncbi:MAG: hypothetical protein AAB354_02505 [candidate division KSB1 bacterium]
MKRRFFSGLLLALSILFLLACESQRPVSSDSSSEIAVLEKGKTYTIESIKPELRKLLDFLKRNPQIITPEVLAKAAERHATITDLGLSEKFPTEFPLENGNTFEVYIELFDGSVGVGNSIEDAQAYFTLDLDRYPEEAGIADPDNVTSFTVHVAATEHNKQKGLNTSADHRRQFSFDQNNPQADYLLILVGGEERLSQANKERRHQEFLDSRPGLAKTSSDTEYWWIVKIRMLDDRDFGGNDEVEMYYGPNGSDGSGNPFESTTGFQFDGGYNFDRTGTQKQFPDINGTGVWNLLSGNYDPIAIEVLTPDSPAGFKVCFIEDDCAATVHKGGNGTSLSKSLNVYDLDVFDDFTRTYTFSLGGGCTDADDIYPNSGTISFGNAPDGCAFSWPSSAHVKMCLRKGTIVQAMSWSSQCRADCTSL